MAPTYKQRRFTLPPDAIEIVLVRHGASQPAVPGEAFPIVDGHADPPLEDPVGHQQAAAVARRLTAPGADPIDAIFTTGLTRTRQTAAPLAEALGVEPDEVHALREVHLGDWEGGEFRIRMQSGDPLALEVLVKQRWDVIPNAEHSDAFAERVRAGLRDIAARIGPGSRAVAFVHGGVIGEACRQAAASRPFAFVHADNCSISRLVLFPNDYWLLRNFNDVAHLDAAPDPV